MKELNQQTLLDGLINKDQKIIKHIYGVNYEVIRRYVRRNSGNNDDVDDIMQDAFVIILEKIISNNLKVSCSFNTYFFSICKNLWLYRLRKQKNKTILFHENMCEIEALIGDPINGHEEKFQKRCEFFYKYYQKLNEENKRIISLKLENTSLKKISDIMGFKNTAVVSKRLYRIKKKLRDQIFRDPLYFDN